MKVWQFHLAPLFFSPTYSLSYPLVHLGTHAVRIPGVITLSALPIPSADRVGTGELTQHSAAVLHRGPSLLLAPTLRRHSLTPENQIPLLITHLSGSQTRDPSPNQAGSSRNRFPIGAVASRFFAAEKFRMKTACAHGTDTSGAEVEGQSRNGFHRWPSSLPISRMNFCKQDAADIRTKMERPTPMTCKGRRQGGFERLHHDSLRIQVHVPAPSPFFVLDPC